MSRKLREKDEDAGMIGGRTVYEFAVKRAVLRRLKEDARWGEALERVAGAMERDHFGAWQDFVVLKQHRTYDIYDAYCMSQIWTWLQSGWLGHAQINVRAVPKADADRDANQKVLTKELAGQFRFVSPDHTGDGDLRWVVPIQLAKTVESTTTFVTVGPAAVALEIGFARSERTYGHLATEMGLARWPYDSQHVLLLYWVDATKHPTHRLKLTP